MVAAVEHHQRLHQHDAGAEMRRTRAAVGLMLGALACGGAAGSALVVCADPNDLPFSNRAGKGFENKIAALLAKDLGVSVSYVWWPQVRGYVRKTLNARKCDVWLGVAAGLDTVAATKSYYRSTYVFVSRESAPYAHLTLDDPRLKTARIGVQMIGNDGTNSPPAHAIASRGLIDNVRGFMVYGDDRQPNPQAGIVAAVAKGDIDVAMVWGPLGGYFAGRSPTPLRVEAVTPADDARWPMAFDIAMGVRQSDPALRDRINTILDREKPALDAILRAYHVPLEAGTGERLGAT
ncbi:MAG: quinoprotein dehydrogenase-associated putative transporter substrate-binding protein [Gammaproteobacteria bacterium]|nr:quinoprotein dehydrogenase-associated putative transporter substrate-binding protein [Gammaproteobacteria bacterium]